MNAWQIGLVVVGVVGLIALVWLEFRGGPVLKRSRSRSADEHGVDIVAKTTSQGTWGSSL